MIVPTAGVIPEADAREVLFTLKLTNLAAGEIEIRPMNRKIERLRAEPISSALCQPEPDDDTGQHWIEALHIWTKQSLHFTVG